MKKRLITDDLNKVSGPKGSDLDRSRFQEAFDLLVPSAQERHDTTDRWAGNGTISIEEEAARTINLQSELDSLVVLENIFPEDEALVTRRGQPPCKRVKKEG